MTATVIRCPATAADSKSRPSLNLRQVEAFSYSLRVLTTRRPD
jgi:hypothetical protein